MSAMSLSRGLVLQSVALLLLGLAFPVAAHNGKTAYAIPLSGITIDGKLDDWPEGMTVYPITEVLKGWSAYVGLGSPVDLTARFRVGYDAAKGYLYIAIEVQDESLVASGGWASDVCEVYINGNHDAIGRTAQYCYVPGNNTAYGFPTNPAMSGDNISKSHVEVAFTRKDQLTIYEWSIEVFDTYPTQKADLRSGKSIGFDLAVVDKDLDASYSWVSWTPGGGKASNASLLGDLILVERYANIGSITGRITNRDGGAPIRGARVEISQEDKPALVTFSDSAGVYRQSVFQGAYTVRTFPRGVRDTTIQRGVEVIGGEEVRVDLSLEDLGTCFYVDDDALDEGDGSVEHPFQTIQKALEATSEGDTVRVLAGVYRESVVLVSGVTLLGAGPDSTVLDGEGKRGVVQITDVNHVVLEGFAIVRGEGRRGQVVTGNYQPPFSGILVNTAQHVRIAHNLISGNITTIAGGGIACYSADSTVAIAHNLIVGNSTKRSQEGGAPGGGAPGGGGIYLQEARPLIYNNTVTYNEAAGDGGGILCAGASPYLHDNIIAYNLNGGLASKPLYYQSDAQAGPGPRLSHNDIWNNAEYDYSGVNQGEGDISADPEFITPGQGDFRLSRGSLCKKAGTAGSMGADVEALQRGEQGLRAAVPPKEVLKQFKDVSPAPGTPVVRKVNYLSVNLPPARKLRIDTVQVEVHPLDLGLLDRHEKVYDRSSGLPGNQVGFIAPAPDGSIWVGTDRGAARYDGLWTYLDTLMGLPGNQVENILPTQDGTVWIATDGGLARYRDGQVQTVSKEWFGKLIEDRAGGLWLGSLGGSQAAHLDTAWTYLSFPSSPGSFGFMPLLVDQGGATWWGNSNYPSSTTVLRYKPQDLQVYELPYFIEPYGGANPLLAKGSKLWMASNEYTSTNSSLTTRIALLDTNSTHLQVYKLSKEWQNYYSLFQDKTGLLWLFGNNILLQYDGQRWFGANKTEFVSPRAALDQEGNFWFASYDRGAIRYGPQTWTTYKGEERLEGKRVTCMAEDQSGNLYFGSEHGLSRRHVDGTWTRLSVTDTLVTDLLVDKQGQVWAATARGIHRYDGHQWTGYTAKNGLPDTMTTVLAEGTDGRIWAGGPKGLFWYDGKGWKSEPVSTWGSAEWSYLYRIYMPEERSEIYDLYTDPKGKLWIATGRGLYLYDRGRVWDYFETFYPDRGVDLDRLSSLKTPAEIRQALKAMLREEIDMIWFLDKSQPGLNFGNSPDPIRSQILQVYDQLMKEDKDFRALSRKAAEQRYAADENPERKALELLGNGPVRTVFSDKTGATWVSSAFPEGGVFTRKDSSWTYFTQSATPFEGRITNTTTDRQGNLWLATTQGAVRYDGQHWTTFDASDGLADNQVNDVLEDREGNIWFATAKGVTRYRPDTRPPQTRMVRGPEGTVGYGTSVLTFEFEGGDWEWEQRGLTFSYALVKGDKKPEDGDWSEWGAQKFVQVPPPEDGHFTFYVRTRDKALNVDPTPATHAFYIAPPLWKVLWFQASTGFGLLLIVFSSTYAIRRRRERDRAIQEFAREQQARLEAQEQLNQELERELQTAHDMQMALMPKAPPRIAGFEITGRCIPANHVGGDLFQYFHQNRKLTVSLADVTGHAMEAAIPMVMFSGILKSQMEVGGSVEELFRRLNHSLHGTLTSHTYVCLAMGELDPASRLFRFSNSGSPYPYHYRAATGEVVELQVDAYPLGVRPDTLYQTIEVQLEPGDRVVFCSDGIIEAANTGGEMFGFERTGEVIRRGCAEDLSAEALLEHLIQEVKAFSGDVPQGDDQTVVVVKVENGRTA